MSLTNLTALVQDGNVLVLSGAGISTESGIPDYRGPRGSLTKRRPIQYRAFTGDPEARKRYWARSAVGWPRLAEAQPNPAHVAVARLETLALATGVITQNVDGLHQAAGSRNVLELHGSMASVRCLDCSRAEPRIDLQDRLLTLNHAWRRDGFAMAPDGDAEIPAEMITSFVVPACRRCGGVLKPNVVFFGESVPKPRVDRAWQMLERSASLLVVGSSLTVFSGFRFVKRAVKDRKPVAIVNVGPTRGEDEATVRVEGLRGEVLPGLVGSLRTERTRRN